MADNINRTLENLTTAINTFTEQASGCCESGGSKTGGTPNSETPTYGGIDDTYPDAQAYFDARCNAANGIFDTIAEFVTWLDDNNVDLKAGVFGGLTTGIAFALVGAGPVGWSIIAGGAVVTSLAIWIIQEILDFEDVGDALNDVHTELVGALYNSGDVPTARNNFLAILGGASPAPTTEELFLVELALTTDLLNNIFDPREDVAVYESPSPISCGALILQSWSFVASGEGWSFRDDSTAGYSSSGSWETSEEAWRISITGSGTSTSFRGKGTILITGLSIAVDVGNSVQADFSETSDGVSMSEHIKIVYADLSEQEQLFPGGAGATTRVLSIDRLGTIEEIEISASRSWQNSFTDEYEDIQEVRVQ